MNATSPAERQPDHQAFLDRIARELTGDANFPICFQAFERIRKTLRDPLADLERTAQAVACEPLIASRLLRLANSPLYARGSNPLRDTRSAIERLGFNIARTTALAIALDQMLKAKQLDAWQSLANDLWENSLRTAALCRALAKQQAGADPEEALLVGLVHNIGAFYLLFCAGQHPNYANNGPAMRELLIRGQWSCGIALLQALELPPCMIAALAEQAPTSACSASSAHGERLALACLLARDEKTLSREQQERILPYRPLRQEIEASISTLRLAFA